MYFWRLSVDQLENEKVLEAPVSEKSSYVCVLFFQKLYHVLTMKG